MRFSPTYAPTYSQIYAFSAWIAYSRNQMAISSISANLMIIFWEPKNTEDNFPQIWSLAEMYMCGSKKWWRDAKPVFNKLGSDTLSAPVFLWSFTFACFQFCQYFKCKQSKFCQYFKCKQSRSFYQWQYFQRYDSCLFKRNNGKDCNL